MIFNGFFGVQTARFQGIRRKCQICSLAGLANPGVWGTKVSFAKHGGFAERIVLVEDFFRAGTALAIGCEVREQAKDHVFEPVDIY